ncbi:MAG TPA: hypothetical protein PLI11_03250 [Clostridia bacterium]|jgi:hypothetical protein|nr:hypothetical protein [Clostridia bacterium]HPZ51911.1 hypothetical protein [Clostridia bacterium]
MDDTCNKYGEGTGTVRIRDYGGYRVICFDRVRVLELNDEKFIVNNVPQFWISGVHIKQQGITFTPAFMKRWNRGGNYIKDLKNVLPTSEQLKRNKL